MTRESGLAIVAILVILVHTVQLAYYLKLYIIMLFSNEI